MRKLYNGDVYVIGNKGKHLIVLVNGLARKRSTLIGLPAEGLVLNPGETASFRQTRVGLKYAKDQG